MTVYIFTTSEWLNFGKSFEPSNGLARERFECLRKTWPKISGHQSLVDTVDTINQRATKS